MNQLPPLALLAKVPDPYRPVHTTGDLVTRLNATESSLKICTAQIDGIRQWRAEVATTK